MTPATVLQLLIGLGLLNVWLVRARSATAYRGSDATDLQAEFRAYGLPQPVFYLVGVLKVGAALALIAGLWVPELVLPAASLIIALMLVALAMHVKVSDPLRKSLPALAMFAMSATLAYLAV